MESTKLETVFLKILKRLLLVIIGSGLIGNALYIYGLGYYQGYIERFGFDYTLFPVEWGDTLIWTYNASRELGASSLPLINQYSVLALFIVIPGFYFLARVWMEISERQSITRKKEKVTKINFEYARKIYDLRINHIWFFRIFYVPFRWLILKEQSFIAFLTSYFLMIFLFFIPLFIIIWIYFPMFGVKHGSLVAEKRLEYYEKYLCGDNDDYWNKCLKINSSEMNISDKQSPTIGRVMFNNTNLLALLTKAGPVTMTIPKTYYFKAELNPCYKNEKCLAD